MKKTSKIPDKWFYFALIALAVYFIIRLIDNSRMIWIFPLDKNHDLPAYIGLLSITTKYAFHNLVPLWFNGFKLFLTYYPAWFYFTLPIYFIFKNILLTTYLSFILIYILGFIFIYFLGKLQRLSLTKRIIFFLFYFANPIALGYLLRIGRITELFSWLILIPLFTILIWYKDHKLNKYFILFPLIYSVLLLSHYTGFIISSSLVLSIFLVKKGIKKKSLIILSLILFLVVTSFWWIPFYKAIINTPFDFTYTSWLIPSLSNTIVDQITSIITSLAFLIIFFFYWSGKYKSKKELLFFLPQIVLAILVLTRLIIFVPLFNRPTPDAYNIFFIFLASFLFLKTKFNFNKDLIKKTIFYALIIIPILAIVVSSIHTPFYQDHTQEDKEIISLMPEVDGKFIIARHESCTETIWCGYTDFHLYSYATIYHNLSTSLGGTPALITKEVAEQNTLLYDLIENEDCNKLINKLNELKITNIIAYDEYCDKLNNCLTQINKNGKACLFKK